MGLHGEIVVRKLQLVYGHWAVGLLILAGLGYALRTWHADIRGFYSRQGALSKAVAVLCVVVLGLVFFNHPMLTHAMFNWGLWQRVCTAAWSLLIALLPTVCLALPARKEYENKVRWFRGTVGLFLVLHTIMTACYVVSPLVAVE